MVQIPRAWKALSIPSLAILACGSTLCHRPAIGGDNDHPGSIATAARQDLWNGRRPAAPGTVGLTSRAPAPQRLPQSVRIHSDFSTVPDQSPAATTPGLDDLDLGHEFSTVPKQAVTTNHPQPDGKLGYVVILPPPGADENLDEGSARGDALYFELEPAPEG
jgi:hypothetical protein